MDAAIAAEYEYDIVCLLVGGGFIPAWSSRDDLIVEYTMRLFRYHMTGTFK